ncbi:ABC transporter permease [Aeromicrobium sp. UC242_57]|uniref:ABC transporter permease n=1 Tax=Aeromicrobium sp. UC242_57 TaxID=3374624 RepID=UPI0037A2C7B3
MDLSIPAVMTVSGVLFAATADGQPSRLVIALLVSVAVGIVAGLANGLGSVVLGIHPVVMTLASSAIISGATLGYTGGLVTGSPPKSVGHFMRGSGGSFPMVLVALVVLAIVVTFVMRQSTYGRRLQAVALNPVAARLGGVSSTATATSTYVISGLCAALGGVMVAGLAGQSYLAMGDPYLLTSVAVVALGGASFAGGHGNFLGTLGGALLLSLLATLLTTYHLAEGWRVIVQGVVILLAVIAAKPGPTADEPLQEPHKERGNMSIKTRLVATVGLALALTR